MKIFVTGSSGFLGRNIVNLLAKHNHSVFALVRDGSKIRCPGLPNVKICVGDLSGVKILTDYLKDMDAVVHAAADTTLGAFISAKQIESNITGTANLIKASQRSGVKRFIHISTANVFTPGSSNSPGTESKRVTITKHLLPYIQTKLHAETLLLSEVRRASFPALILNPTFMIGPEDYKPSSGKLVLAIIKNKLPFYPPGGKNMVDVRDVAEAVLQALSIGSIGENYLIANENISYKDLFSQVYEKIQLERAATKLPYFLLRGIGEVGTTIERLTGKSMSVNHFTSKMACEFHYYSNAKATTALVFTPRPYHETLSETINWFTHEYLVYKKS